MANKTPLAETFKEAGLEVVSSCVGSQIRIVDNTKLTSSF